MLLLRTKERKTEQRSQPLKNNAAVGFQGTVKTELLKGVLLF